jgi:hypothetical protein
MAEFKFLPKPKQRGRVFKWVLLGLVAFIAYVTIGNSTSSENLQQFVRDRSQVDVVRYSDYTVGIHSKVVIVRDDQDGRTAMAFVKVPFMDRWNLTERVSVDGKETKPIAMNIDDGYSMLQAEVNFDRVNILESTRWSGTYAKSISILIFILLAVGINFWMDRKKRPQVGSGT